MNRANNLDATEGPGSQAGPLFPTRSGEPEICVKRALPDCQRRGLFSDISSESVNRLPNLTHDWALHHQGVCITSTVMVSRGYCLRSLGSQSMRCRPKAQSTMCSSWRAVGRSWVLSQWESVCRVGMAQALGRRVNTFEQCGHCFQCMTRFSR
jgi:hypothetical protein